jgi:Putative O-antigen polymerase
MITFCWYLFLLIICIGMESLTKCFSTLNIFTLFILFFLMNHGIGVPFALDINGETIELDLPEHVIIRWIASLVIMYVCFLIGILIAKGLFGNKMMNTVEYKRELLYISRDKITSVRKTFVLIAIIITVFVFIQLWNPNLLIVALAKEFGAEEYKAARLAYGQGINSEVNVIARIAVTLKFVALPLLVNISYALKDVARKYSYLFWFVFITYVLLQLVTGQKAAISLALVSLLVCQLFKSGNCSISIKNKVVSYTVIALVLLLVTLLPGQYMLQYPGLNYGEALASVVNRLTAETSRTLQLHFYVYPDKLQHLNGGSSFLFSGLFGGGTNIDPGRAVRGYVLFGDAAEASGTWNAAFIGAAWADFGYIGVVVESILVTMLLWFYHQWFLTQRKVPGVVGLYSTLVMSCTSLSEANLLTTLFTFGLGSSFILYFFLKDFRISNQFINPHN